MKQIIKKPLISEKSFALSNEGKYCFITETNIDKISAKEHIERMFKVTVTKINIQSVEGKTKRVRGKSGKRDNFKKIIATLKKGQSIRLFESEKEDKKHEDKNGVKTAIKTKTLKTPKDKKEKE